MAALAVVIYSAMNTILKMDHQHERVQKVMDRVRAAQNEIQLRPLNMSIVEGLRTKQSSWRDNWVALLQLEESNQQQIATHWAQMKEAMLANAAAKHDELNVLRESERDLMQHLHEWKTLQHEIDATRVKIASTKAEISRQQEEKAALRRDAIAKGHAVVQRQADRDDVRRLLHDEAIAARDAASFHHRVLTSVAVAGGIVAFGAVVITFRARRSLHQASHSSKHE